MFLVTVPFVIVFHEPIFSRKFNLHFSLAWNPFLPRMWIGAFNSFCIAPADLSIFSISSPGYIGFADHSEPYQAFIFSI